MKLELPRGVVITVLHSPSGRSNTPRHIVMRKIMVIRRRSSHQGESGLALSANLNIRGRLSAFVHDSHEPFVLPATKHTIVPWPSSMTKYLSGSSNESRNSTYSGFPRLRSASKGISMSHQKGQQTLSMWSIQSRFGIKIFPGAVRCIYNA